MVESSADQTLPRAPVPAITGDFKSPPPRASTFPGSVISDVASGSSNSQQDVQRNTRRTVPIGGPLVRNSTSQTLHETWTESSAIDPLSQHIIQRTNTQKSIPLKLLGQASYEAEAGGSEYNLSDQNASRGDAASNSKLPKEKKKGVSFLSRIIGNKKRDTLSEAEDDSSEAEASRMSIDTSHPIGFIPRHPAPSRYMKVRAHYKKDKTFNRLFLAQELQSSGMQQPIAGRRGSTSTNANDDTGRAVWALSFSKDGKYLAAAGQDRKVRVWAVITTPEEREEAAPEGDTTEGQQDNIKAPVFLSKPIHVDFVTSIQFHPKDDRFFLAGSLDSKLRLWSIPDKSVAFMTTVPDMITAVAFTPDGRYSMAGCLNGLLNIYDTEGLKVSGQIHVRSARGRNSKGNKITGIDTMMVPADDPCGDIKVLVTSNDSRIRLYDFRERALEAKFRGNENTCSQIRASFTEDGKHVICGSEDRRAYVWPIGAVQRDSDKRAVEVFETQSAIVTVAVTAPIQTKQLLGLSEDPIYDICNPPPVALMSPEESVGATPRQASSDTKSEHKHKRSASAPRLSIVKKMAGESPSFLARSKHPDGSIIVIADYSGKIKVLRQDCAYQKRRHENWDHSTISRRILGRSNSTHYSIASSMSKDSAHKTPSERIVSWRNSVIRNGRASTDGSRSGLRTRSPSPQHRPPVFRLSSSRPSSLAPNESLSANAISPPSSPRRSRLDHSKLAVDPNQQNGKPAVSSADIVASGKTKDNPLWLQGDHSYAYWNKITHDALAAKSRHKNDFLSPNRIPSGGERKVSVSGSVLSSEYGSSTGEVDEDILKCEHCRGTNFRGVKDRGGKQKLICVQCNRSVS
ncbi:Oxo-4-hydroxy-4-carboxy-5-ureidoimidazoline decarboxylase [Penicillium verhagenii]|uniref:Oxo-4-hydroxy-4-carboxy-5-ureidoimidazoline decarboxylase n=1 Tax=Penicillium verhagenii TaxID=1562060 RepID=UPI002545B136|nr:Oxo-4-hydroxy-4-carboxy-5-ureidoimidazoline decarboxylase [Penicillium verhagenii]KAJ5939132.1 Oxo-4-hydroxy-4-carboxy-5-ureidoimidazoline decarboxylase [Penicillium verhagenii]